MESSAQCTKESQLLFGREMKLGSMQSQIVSTENVASNLQVRHLDFSKKTRSCLCWSNGICEAGLRVVKRLSLFFNLVVGHLISISIMNNGVFGYLDCSSIDYIK